MTKSAMAVPCNNIFYHCNNMKWSYRLARGASQHSEDGRVTVVKADTVDDTEVGQVILNMKIIILIRDRGTNYLLPTLSGA